MTEPCNAIRAGEPMLLCNRPADHRGDHCASVSWADPEALEEWLAKVRPGDRPWPYLAGAPLGAETCDENSEDGFWCVLPKYHRGSRHVSQDRTRVYAAWETL